MVAVGIPTRCNFFRRQFPKMTVSDLCHAETYFSIPWMKREEGNVMVSSSSEPRDLVVLLTTGDREVVLRMVVMYLSNAARKGWWRNSILVIWGPSAWLVSEDREIQDRIRQLKENGVVIEACQTCAEEYRVESVLSDLGITVRLMGEPLTGYLKDPGCKVITF